MNYDENEYKRRQAEIEEFWTDLDKFLDYLKGKYGWTETSLEEYPEEVKRKILDDE